MALDKAEKTLSERNQLAAGTSKKFGNVSEEEICEDAVWKRGASAGAVHPLVWISTISLLSARRR